MTNEASLEKWRDDTPGVSNNIHFNNAGAALMPKVVIDVIKEHLDLEAQMGGYEAATNCSEAIKSFYTNLARVFGGKPQNFAFTSNATDAFSRALSSIKFEVEDVILTSSNDYASNFISFMSLQKRFGIRIIVAENSSSGVVDLQTFKKLVLQHQPKLVSITHIPTNSGLIQPVAEIGLICRNYGIIYLVDGCQSAGQLQVNIPNIGCDFYSATFRKFLRGPRGSGFLFVSDRILAQELYPLFLDMRGADWISDEDFSLNPTAARFEDWENPYALLLGASAALAYAAEIGLENIERRSLKLAQNLREKLGAVPGIEILDRGQRQGAIVTLFSKMLDHHTIKPLLQMEHINCSLIHRVSARLDFEEKGVDWALRFSPHYYNSSREVNQVVHAMEKITKNS